MSLSRKGYRLAVAVMGAAVIGLVTTLVIVLNTRGDSQTHAVSRQITVTETPSWTRSTVVTTPPASGKPTIAEFSGNGDKQTEKFTAPAAWQIAWSFDCTNAGSSFRHFRLEAEGISGRDAGDSISITGRDQGTDVQHYYRAGEYFLAVSTSCRWQAIVSG